MKIEGIQAPPPASFRVKQIVEIKNKQHNDPIFTYWDSEIASEMSKRFKRFRLDCRPLYCVL